jgi:hypothetical protein
MTSPLISPFPHGSCTNWVQSNWSRLTYRGRALMASVNPAIREWQGTESYFIDVSCVLLQNYLGYYEESDESLIYKSLKGVYLQYLDWVLEWIETRPGQWFLQFGFKRVAFSESNWISWLVNRLISQNAKWYFSIFKRLETANIQIHLDDLDGMFHTHYEKTDWLNSVLDIAAISLGRSSYFSSNRISLYIPMRYKRRCVQFNDSNWKSALDVVRLDTYDAYGRDIIYKSDAEFSPDQLDWIIQQGHVISDPVEWLIHPELWEHYSQSIDWDQFRSVIYSMSRSRNHPVPHIQLFRFKDTEQKEEQIFKDLICIRNFIFHSQWTESDAIQFVKWLVLNGNTYSKKHGFDSATTVKQLVNRLERWSQLGQVNRSIFSYDGYIHLYNKNLRSRIWIN